MVPYTTFYDWRNVEVRITVYVLSNGHHHIIYIHLVVHKPHCRRDSLGILLAALQSQIGAR